MSVDARMITFVASQHAGVLATLKRNGRPQLSNLFYAWDDVRMPAPPLPSLPLKPRGRER